MLGGGGERGFPGTLYRRLLSSSLFTIPFPGIIDERVLAGNSFGHTNCLWKLLESTYRILLATR